MNYSSYDMDISAIALDTKLYYKGIVEALPDDVSLGTVVYCDNTTWINTDVGWDPLFSMVSDRGYYLKEEEIHIIYPTNCKNCGAILHNNVCEYCGSDNGEYKRY